MRNYTVKSLNRRGAEVVLLEDQLNLFSNLSVETILEGAQYIFVTPLESHIRCDPGRTRGRGMYVDRQVSCPASRPNTRATAIESLPVAQARGEWRRSPLPARPGSCVRTHVPSFGLTIACTGSVPRSPHLIAMHDCPRDHPAALAFPARTWSSQSHQPVSRISLHPPVFLQTHSVLLRSSRLGRRYA